jgi:large subunit ribosomal protein L6
MSRFGKLPVEVPQNVTVEVAGDTFKVSGPKGALEKKLPRGVEIEISQGSVNVIARASGKQVLSNQGTTRSHLANMVKGVSEGFSIQLELVGSGYRAEVRGKELVLNIGYSHPIIFEAPENVNFKVEKSIVTIEGIDKEVVGQLAAKIRETRKPDPYKAKGVKYINEVVRRKAGKQAAKTA